MLPVVQTNIRCSRFLFERSEIMMYKFAQNYLPSYIQNLRYGVFCKDTVEKVRGGKNGRA